MFRVANTCPSDTDKSQPLRKFNLQNVELFVRNHKSIFDALALKTTIPACNVHQQPWYGIHNVNIFSLFPEINSARQG